MFRFSIYYFFGFGRGECIMCGDGSFFKQIAQPITLEFLALQTPTCSYHIFHSPFILIYDMLKA